MSKIAPLLSLFLIVVISGCFGDEEFSTSPTDSLTLSSDTLSLDTVISGESTTTYKFWAYNPHKKAVRLRQIQLEKGTGSPFRVNVDGMFLPGGSLPPDANIEVSGGDSIRVFVEMTAPKTESDSLIKIEDKLTFTTESGASSKIVLTAAAQDVITLKGVIVSDTLTLSGSKPYRILDSLYVAPGATLRVAPGTTLLFHARTSLKVAGKLLAEGTQDKPVTFRCDRLDLMFENQPYDRVPGNWGGLAFVEGSVGNRLTYCDIHGGTSGIKATKAELRIENSSVHNFVEHLVESIDSDIYIGNSEVTVSGGDCMIITGGSLMAVHCTIVRCMPIMTYMTEPAVALRFSNGKPDDKHPLTLCDFYNCIITGSEDDDIMGEDCSTTDDLTAFNYHFHSCLLNTPESEDISQEGCLWDKYKPDAPGSEKDEDSSRLHNFDPLFNEGKLIWDFTLNPKSKAVGSADATVTWQTYPNDRNGHSRMTDSKSDMGCYEYISPENKQ